MIQGIFKKMIETKDVKIEDSEYPEALKNIKSDPKVLYYKGTLPQKDEKCVAIVGTRRFSPYGQQVALKISGQLSDAGITVVSGLAPGIDTFAHQAVVEKRKRTIAILGTGLDEKSIYPQTNIKLAERILENGGCLISEWPDGTKGSKFSFPRRNRIISGLSLAVLVIEAKEKSGSLITANFAKEQNKKLFAVPGQIYSVNSAGPNKLIREGAFLTENADDILEKLNLKPFKLIQEKISADDPEEKIILEALEHEPLTIDKIIEKTKLNASLISSKLALLEISGKICNLKGNVYSLS